MKPRIGMVTIGQAPRTDVVPEMADVIGADVEILEAGALDGLTPEAISALAPAGDHDVLVTRLLDGSAVFLGKPRVTPLVQRRIADLEAAGVSLTVLLCTGTFTGLEARRPLLQPDGVLRGVLSGVRFPGRLGVVAPSERHVASIGARWRSYGFDPVVVASSPYHGGDDTARAIDAFRAGGVGFVLLSCMGFRREAREALARALGVPVVAANLLVARVVAELAGG